MISIFLDYFSHNKYRLMMFLLLAGATIFSVLIWRVRSEVSGTVHYAFLIWNLFLAWIPFIIAYFTYTAPLRRKQIYIVVPIAAFFWLIFFPNAPYVLTDFQHLAGVWRDVPVWYDVMLLIWFAFTGLLLWSCLLVSDAGDHPPRVWELEGLGIRYSCSRLEQCWYLPGALSTLEFMGYSA